MSPYTTITTPYFKTFNTSVCHDLLSSFPDLNELVHSKASITLRDYMLEKGEHHSYLVFLGQAHIAVSYTTSNPRAPLVLLEFTHLFTQSISLNCKSNLSNIYTPCLTLQDLFLTILTPRSLYCNLQLLGIVEHPTKEVTL